MVKRKRCLKCARIARITRTLMSGQMSGWNQMRCSICGGTWMARGPSRHGKKQPLFQLQPYRRDELRQTIAVIRSEALHTHIAAIFRVGTSYDLFRAQGLL